MENHDAVSEPGLSAERMGALDNSRTPRAEVEERIVGALRGNGVLRNDFAAAAVQGAAGSVRRTAWMSLLFGAAATLMFFAGMKVGESRSHAQTRGGLADAGSTGDSLALPCPVSTIAAHGSPAHIVWY